MYYDGSVMSYAACVLESPESLLTVISSIELGYRRNRPPQPKADRRRTKQSPVVRLKRISAAQVAVGRAFQEQPLDH